MQLVKKKFVAHFEHKIFLQFVGIMAALYVLNSATIALISPGGKIYSPFVASYFNYIDWISSAVLNTSDWMNSFIGIPTYFSSPLSLSLASGHKVVMGFSCMGLQLISCWCTFLILYGGKILPRMVAAVGGIGVIILINACRISLLLFSIAKNWRSLPFADHHTLFNIVAYLVLAIIGYFFIKSKERSKLAPITPFSPQGRN
jgi:exosortase/archaeosortase family protein